LHWSFGGSIFKRIYGYSVGYSNKAVDDRARFYRSAFAKGEYTPFSVRTTPVGWKNIADGQKAVERRQEIFDRSRKFRRNINRVV
jgi:hypothetical protein